MLEKKKLLTTEEVKQENPKDTNQEKQKNIFIAKFKRYRVW